MSYILQYVKTQALVHVRALWHNIITRNLDSCVSGGETKMRSVFVLSNNKPQKNCLGKFELIWG